MQGPYNYKYIVVDNTMDIIPKSTFPGEWPLFEK